MSEPGSTTMIDYAASKAALITLTKSVAVQLAKRGVRANVVAPGPTWTPLNGADPDMPPDGLAHIGSEAPLERAAQPEEIAPTCVYLASDADSGCTVGEVIAVTGGIVDTR
ncbi:SDR family oxidoreductase [Streptomyces sp. CA-179760]|uniref:SDR family oxidoreductase n=1 Tax=Streptomyces sp. CA-179760 TaxID=3240054 RepID=UPI003D9251AC